MFGDGLLGRKNSFEDQYLQRIGPDLSVSGICIEMLTTVSKLVHGPLGAERRQVGECQELQVADNSCLKPKDTKKR